MERAAGAHQADELGAIRMRRRPRVHAPGPRANLLAVNRKVPLTGFEGALGFGSGPTGGRAAIANLRPIRIPGTGARLGIATSLPAFTFGDGRTAVVGKYEGVMIPKNGLYKFTADESENLVMLRVGGGVRTATGLKDLTPFGTPKDVVQKTSFADGEVKQGDAAKNGETAKPRVYARGKYFAPD